MLIFSLILSDILVKIMILIILLLRTMYRRYKIKHCVIDNLVDDLLGEILSKLPVKNLLRCRSVSKRWYDLTKTPNFISKHRRHLLVSSSDNCHPCMIFLNLSKEDGVKTFDDEHEFLFVSDENGLKVSSRRLPMLSFVKNVKEITIIGSNNGLVNLYMHVEISSDDNEIVCEQVMVMWNPATEEYRILPKPNTKVTSIMFSKDEVDNVVRINEDSVKGSLDPLIGLDFTGDEYKVARIFCQNSLNDDDGYVEDDGYYYNYEAAKSGKVFHAQVFVPSKNSWRDAKNELAFVSRQRPFPSTSITLNGVMYWKVLQEHLLEGGGGKRDIHRECYIMSFDIHDEVFDVIALPIELRAGEFNNVKLYSWENSLAAFGFSYGTFWAMNFDNKIPVWTKQYTFENHDVFQEAADFYGLWKDSQFIFTHVLNVLDDDFYELEHDEDDRSYTPHEVVLYNPKTRTKKDILKQENVQGIYISRKVSNYIETIVKV